ncbi:MAG: nucleoside hydrolase [Acidimicrobiales bacterium]|jgi:inosine-uridine nucleoside N-ribohydrolase|nr:nucleoside hydrolase [Acidimicrobiales bacterium]
MARVRMLLDCDPGLDDAIALLIAAHLTDLVGITTVNGNVGIDHTTHNALAIAQVAQLDVPIHRGAARPYVNEPIDAAYVHGATGLGSVEVPDVTGTVVSDDAAGFIVESARSIADLELVAVGPLTNIADAVTADPDLRGRLGGFTIMGGAAVGGNTTATSEFNIWADPEAADVVFRTMAPFTMVGLDVTHQVLLGPAERDRMRAAATPASLLAADLLDYAVARAGELRGSAGAPIHDACAVLAVTHPHLFAGTDHPVEVELTGTHTRGMTVVDARPMAETDRPIHVLRDADSAAAIDVIVESVLALGSS